jgi:hypothetical protein
MKLLDTISTDTKEPAQVIQFAKDGKYEQSWIISLINKHPNLNDIESYLSNEPYENLIVEYIWNPEVDANRYVLTVIQDGSCKVKDGKEFVSTCLDIFYSRLDFPSVIQALNSRIVGSDFLLNSNVELVRLGIFNHWFSTGPIDLWETGELLEKHVIDERINLRPEIRSTSLNYQGLAFIYNFNKNLSGPYHILKTPCCKKAGNIWAVDNDLVFKWMSKLV